MIRHAIAFALLSLAACGGPSEYVLTGSERTAGTDGMLIVDTRSHNHLMTIDLEHLPPPTRISEGATVYLVWVKPEDGHPSLAGRLEYDEDERTGHMTATTPEDRFTVLITAEEDASVATPSDVVVARQEVLPGDD